MKDNCEFKVIGLLYSPSLTASELNSLIDGFQKDSETVLSKHEIVLCSIDRETAQKYGLFKQLELTECVATLSKRITNFYYEYIQDLQGRREEVIDYCQSANGCVVILGPKTPELEGLIRYAYRKDFIDIFSYNKD